MRGVVHNFSPGPAALPQEVLEEARDELLDFGGSGMSVMEMSHRSATYEAVHREALNLARRVSGAPEDFEVLFLQGGASLQFAMVPLNLLAPGQRAGYVVSGAWGARAHDDARAHGEVYEAWNGRSEAFRRMPHPGEIAVRPETRYLHVTSNETIDGIRMVQWPDSGVPLVADVSSEFMARPLPWERFDLVYGGAQKNLAPAGLSVLLIRRSLLEETNRALASYLRYDVHARHSSLYNTPPVFSIYLLGKVLRRLDALGGAVGLSKRSASKAAMLYDAFELSDGFYRSPVDPASRSHMNVVFRLPREELERRFLSEAQEAGLVGLAGHRSVGGCRASLYAAVSEKSVGALVAFMEAFQSHA